MGQGWATDGSINAMIIGMSKIVDWIYETVYRGPGSAFALIGGFSVVIAVLVFVILIVAS